MCKKKKKKKKWVSFKALKRIKNKIVLTSVGFCKHVANEVSQRELIECDHTNRKVPQLFVYKM